MNICFDAAVVSQDGSQIGKIKHIVYDPRLREVTHLVIHKGVLLPHDALIPMSLVQGNRDHELILHVASHDVGELPRYDEGVLRTGPAGSQEVAETPAGERFGVNEPPERAQQLRRAIHVEPGSVELTKKTEVEALDGGLGTVRCLQVDQYTNRLTYLVVKEGSRSRGRHHAKLGVPAEWVSEVGSDKVSLSVSRQQALEGHPPPAGPYIPVEPHEEELHP